jgi:hypothetical protein
MSRPIKPRLAKQPDEYANNPLNLFLDIPKDYLATPRIPRMKIIGGTDDGSV